MDDALPETSATPPEPGPAPRRPSAENMRTYRKTKIRLDYYPSPAARAAIDRLHERYPAHPIRSIIDAMVLAADRARSGNRSAS